VEQLDSLDQQVLAELQGLPAIRVQLERRDKLVNQALRVPRVHLVLREQVEHLALLVLLVFQVRLGLVGLTVHLETRVLKDQLEVQDQLGHLAHLDHLEYRVLLETPDLLGLQEIPVA